MKKISAAVLAVLMVLLMSACGDNSTESDPQNTQSPTLDQGQNDADSGSDDNDDEPDSEHSGGTAYSQTVTVSKTIEQFNGEITKKALKYPVDNEYVTIHENAYFFGIVDDLGFYIYPVQYTGDQTVDVSLEMGVFIPSESKNTVLLENYVNCLLKANDPTLTDDTIVAAMDSARELRDLDGDGEYIDLENGLYLGYDTDFDGNIRYVVMRVYR